MIVSDFKFKSEKRILVKVGSEIPTEQIWEELLNFNLWSVFNLQLTSGELILRSKISQAMQSALN